MAVVVLGGLLTTAVVNVFVVPVLYFRYGFRRRSGQLDRRAVRAGSGAANHPGRGERRHPAANSARSPGGLPIMPALLLPGCGGAVADAYTIEHEPASVATPAGSDHPQVILEEEAAQRLAIQTTVVQPAPEGVAVPSRRFSSIRTGTGGCTRTPSPWSSYATRSVWSGRREASRTSPAVRRREPRW